MVLTVSTLSCQAVAGANKQGKAIHVFSAVTDPAGAGIGLKAMGTTDKPPYLTGIGSFQPVEAIFRFARELWPDLKTVGVVWNQAEANSVACTMKAREISRILGITLLEATIEKPHEVGEAAESLVARGVQAFWTGGDTGVNTAIDSLCGTALKARIPVFSNIAGHGQHGTLFDLGADYWEVGRRAGNIAADILEGADPARIAVTNFMPEKIVFNRKVLRQMKDPWRFPDTALARANSIIEEDGTERKLDAVPVAPVVPTAPRAIANRMWKLGVAGFGPDEGAESALRGLFDGLRELGYEEGLNLAVRRTHASGEIANIPTMLQDLDSGDSDAIVTLSTPVLVSACSAVRKKPVVFTYVIDPIAAGAGRTVKEHLSHITGVSCFPPLEQTMEFCALTITNLRTIGTFYNAGEANASRAVSVLRELSAKRGFKFIELTLTGSAEVSSVAEAVAARHPDVIIVPADNTIYQAFDAVLQVAMRHRLPVVIDAPEFVTNGVLAAVGAGYYQTGKAAADPLARVLNGQSPAGIPFTNVTVETIVLNEATARRLGLTFPPAVRAMQSKNVVTPPTN